MNSQLHITLIQTKLHWEDREANLAMFEEKINSINQPTEIVILPEMFSTGFSMKATELAEEMSGGSVAWMKRIAAEKKIIITGSLIIKEKENYFNRLIWMLPTGEYGFYNKRHLFAYAGEDRHYTAGNKRLIASVKGWKINLQVCYDLRFPVWARHAASPASSKNDGHKLSPEYDLLIYVANWPDKRSIAWKTLLQARAIENQCYVIGVNRVGEDANKNYYSGDSMVIDPLGEILYNKKDEEDIFTCTLQKSHLEEIRHKLPFWKDADAFEIYTS